MVMKLPFLDYNLISCIRHAIKREILPDSTLDGCSTIAYHKRIKRKYLDIKVLGGLAQIA